jgi:Domain of unknown function (DUF4821)
LLEGKDEDHYLAELVQSKADKSALAIVAESGGEVVGFMSLKLNVDQNKLRHMYILEPFKNLAKRTYLLTIGINLTSELFADAADSGPVETELLQNTIGINIFCIESKFSAYSYQFINVAFQHFRDIDYCVISHPPNVPELRLCRDFIPIKARNGKMDVERLYLASCNGNQEVASVRIAKDDDLGDMHIMLDGIPNPEHSSRIINSVNNPESLLFVSTVMGHVVGIILLKKCINQQAFTDQFDVETFLDVKEVIFQDKCCIVEHIIFNPLFECQVRHCLGEVMRQIKLPGLVYCRAQPENEDHVSKIIATREFVPVRCRRM